MVYRITIYKNLQRRQRWRINLNEWHRLYWCHQMQNLVHYSWNKAKNWRTNASNMLNEMFSQEYYVLCMPRRWKTCETEDRKLCVFYSFYVTYFCIQSLFYIKYFTERKILVFQLMAKLILSNASGS
jgi:hypothetical protein